MTKDGRPSKAEWQQLERRAVNAELENLRLKSLVARLGRHALWLESQADLQHIRGLADNASCGHCLHLQLMTKVTQVTGRLPQDWGWEQQVINRPKGD